MKSLNNLLGLGLVLRILFLLYGSYQDSYFDLKYTDVDYNVFTDAARFVTLNQSPYERQTYRYTPLIAIILTPNIYLPVFGKLIFVICDLLVGILIHYILLLKGINNLVYPAIWILNPFVINISTRGSCESLICLSVLAATYYIMSNRLFLGSLLFGLSVHLKIYPIIYAVSFLLFLDSRSFKKHLVFFIISASTFFILGIIMYLINGHDFIEHTYLYHLTRKDHRHNFSIYFYQMYLHHSDSSKFIKLVSFIPQLLVCFVMGLLANKDLILALFTQTFSFVMFNKVATSQYFMWYLCFLPIVLATNDLVSSSIGLFVLGFWVAGQALWLSFAYRLEFLGENTFLELFVSSIVFFAINTWVLSCFIKYHRFGVKVKPKKSEKGPVEKVINYVPVRSSPRLRLLRKID